MDVGDASRLFTTWTMRWICPKCETRNPPERRKGKHHGCNHLGPHAEAVSGSGGAGTREQRKEEGERGTTYVGWFEGRTRLVGDIDKQFRSEKKKMREEKHSDVRRWKRCS